MDVCSTPTGVERRNEVVETRIPESLDSGNVKNTGNEKDTKETVISTEDITTDNITYKKIISDVNVPVKETANGTTGGMYKMYTYVFRVDSLEYYIQGVVTCNKDETKMQEYMASMELLLNDMIDSIQIQ